ncbi:MAG TPA: YbhB/YbcL family Raf kinase inhibitor-like protein [Holophaga sp.]|nr:YbhB/YbcL family Raf kinase inhibitor-like protein [Holophaga sp.]
MDVCVPAIPRGGAIPRTFTADGADVSPALSWNDPPAGTHGFAVIMEDPDAPAGLWTHWILYGLPGSARSLGGELPKVAVLPDGSRQGRNTWGRLGYNGPAPPPGKPHRYAFRVLALSGGFELPAGATRAALDHALEGKVLAEGAFMAKYGR